MKDMEGGARGIVISDGVDPNLVNGGRNDDLEMTGIHKIGVRPPQSLLDCIEGAVKETLFPDDPFRKFKNQPPKRKFLLGIQYLFPILEWAPKYSFGLLKSDLISGITIASLAIPQGISYAKLANLPPIIGLYSSFVPPLIYATMGSSRDLAVGTVAVCSLLIASMLRVEVSGEENSALHLHLAFTATFFAGIFQAALGIFRLGFVIDFLSHATLVGFISGMATVVSLQQLKGILGVQHFTTKTDIVSVMESVWGQTKKWRWESIVLGLSFLWFLLITRHISKKKPKLFWISAAAPLTSVIVGSLLVFLTHAERHGIQIVGHLKSGINPLSLNSLVFQSSYLKTTLKAGLITGIISLTEGIAIGRTFSLLKNYHIDGNKEMIAIGMMNIVGSCTSCYITTGVFSRSAVNFNAGCKTAVSNIVMAIAVMITLLFLTPLFHYTPLAILSSIIVSAMIGLIDFRAAYHMWKVDKIDCLVCMAAYVGVVFVNVEVGLGLAVAISIIRVLLHVSRPLTAVLGSIPNTSEYKDTAQYPDTIKVPGIFILSIGCPIYFANSGYLRERIMRWITEEEDRLAKLNEDTLQYVILDMSAVTTIDTSGIAMLEELKKTVERGGLQLVLGSLGMDAMEKLQKAKFIEFLGQNWFFFTVGEAVRVCNSLIRVSKLNIINNDNINNESVISPCTNESRDCHERHSDHN